MHCRLIPLRMPTVPRKHVAIVHQGGTDCFKFVYLSLQNHVLHSKHICIHRYIATFSFENRRLCLVVPKERECFAPHPHVACQNEVLQVLCYIQPIVYIVKLRYLIVRMLKDVEKCLR